MNIYLVVEGKAESIIYPNWIAIVNPMLSRIDNPSLVNQNNFYMISDMGYPKIFSAIDSSIADITLYRKYNRLIIAVDSEDMTRDDKYTEFNDYLLTKTIPCEVKIIIQHFCIETWALGNRKILGLTSQSERLRNYRRLFDVRSQDPELLPSKPNEDMNRAQFAKKYLQLVINDVRKTMTYTPGEPRPVNEKYYFEQIRRRYEQTNHIKSFNGFLTAFI